MGKTATAICKRVIRLLQEERESRKISKYMVAQKSGLSPQMISYIEREMRNPTLETTLRIAEALEVDLGELIRRARREVLRKRV